MISCAGNSCFEAVKVTDKVYWVGAIDWNLRNFHGYRTSRGSTYNAFLILDEKVTLIDTVKAPFFDEMKSRIASVIDPTKIDYIVSNHAEMDHSGSLPRAIAEFAPVQVFCSTMGEKALHAHFGADLALSVLKTGDTLPLGKNTLHFIETRMLHWPDSMFSYLDGEKVLFSQDAFGMHLSGSGRFAEEYDDALLLEEAKKYFANILLLQAPKVLELLKAFPGFGLDVAIAAPDHGPIWRNSDFAKILTWYQTFAEQKPQNKAVVVYDTMWGSTAKMANAVADGLIASGVRTEVISLQAADRSLVMTKVLDAGIVVCGSPTINNNIYPSLADLLTYMRGLRPKNLIGGIVGSYGWSGEGHKQIAEYFTQMQIAMPEAPVAVKYIPTADDLQKCRALGAKLAEALHQSLQS